MNKDLSIYVHIPFCKNICLYCNFLTFAHKNAWIPQYVDSLCYEIRERAKTYGDKKIETIYFGGGTPSLIEPELIKKIIQEIRAYYKVKRSVEICIECNPESVDANRLKIYKEAGITRFSLGVQSLNKKTLFRVARPHDSKKIFEALADFKKAGIKNFGTDFIMGLPGQTFASFKKEVETILTHNPSHLSFYFLSYDTKKIDNFIKECPGEDEQIQMYTWLCNRLKRAKFTHYEVSNWAKRGHECEHNKRYWNQKDYLGVGIGAHSIVDSLNFENQKNFEGYLHDPLKTEEHLVIDPEIKRQEFIMLGLRTHKGIDLKKYSKMGIKKNLTTSAQNYIKSGHLKISNGHLIATELKGFLILDTITQSLQQSPS